MHHWISFLIVLSLIIYITIKSFRRKTIDSNKRIFFLRESLLMIAFLLLIYLFDWRAYASNSLFNMNKGFPFGVEIISIVAPIFFIPPCIELLKLKNHDPKDIERKNIFGFPTVLLPNNQKSLLSFTIYIIIGVLFEELVCRQLLFYYFFTLLKIDGDLIIILSSILFAIPHIYQGLKGIVSNLFIGLILGKLFLVSGNILYPIVLHLALNSTLIIIAWKYVYRETFLRQVKEKTQSIIEN